MTGKAGLVIDNLLEVEMVLADGKIVIAPATENPDLFWALRGAGSSFRVVTKFVYRAFDQKGPVWGGLMVLSKTQLEELVSFANTILDAEHQGKAMTLMAL